MSKSTRFQPGQSGNPGGRPAIPDELKVRLQNLSTKAVDALEQALGSPDDRVRIVAATALLDRAFGRPAQQADVTKTAVDTSHEHLQALLRMAKRRAAEPLQLVAPTTT